MKKFKLFKLLALFVVLIASINTAWAVTYNPSGVAQQTMQSQQIVTTGGAYTGAVYEPFSETTPSEQSAVGASQTPAKAPSGPRKGRTPGEATNGTDLSPIGEPWVMVILAIGFGIVIMIRQRRKIAMKKTSKFITIVGLLLTFGIGNAWADAGINNTDGANVNMLVDGIERINMNCSGSGTSPYSATTIVCSSLILEKVYMRTWKDNNNGGKYGNICTPKIYYHVYRAKADWSYDDWQTSWTTSGEAPTLTEKSNKSEGSQIKQEWQNESMNIDVTDGLPEGRYVFEYNFQVTGSNSANNKCDETFYYNNSSQHYRVPFVLKRSCTVSSSIYGNDIFLFDAESGTNLYTWYNDGSDHAKVTWPGENIYTAGAGKTNIFDRIGNYFIFNTKNGSSAGYDSYTTFILNKDGKQTGNLSYSTYQNGGFYKYDSNTSFDRKYECPVTITRTHYGPIWGDRLNMTFTLKSWTNLNGGTYSISADKGARVISGASGSIASAGGSATCTIELPQTDGAEDDVEVAFDYTVNSITFHVKAYIHVFQPIVIKVKDEVGFKNIHMKMTTKNAEDYNAWPGVKQEALGNDWYIIRLNPHLNKFWLNNGTNEKQTYSEGMVASDFHTDEVRQLLLGGAEPKLQKCYLGSAGDYGVTLYRVETYDGTKTYHSNSVTGDVDAVMSFYADLNNGSSTYKLKSLAANATSWSQVADIDKSTFTDVYNGASATAPGNVFTAKLNNATPTGITGVKVFDGDYLISCAASTENFLTHGEGNEGTTGTKFTYFTPNTTIFGTEPFYHYWVDWFPKDQTVVASVGNEYNSNLLYTIGEDLYAPAGIAVTSNGYDGGNVRFGFNPKTGYFTRTIIAGSGSQISVQGERVNPNSAGYGNAASFTDASSWVYTISAVVKGDATATTTTSYNGYAQTLASGQKLIGGDGNDDVTAYNVVITYDFKTNRLLAAWKPGALIDPFSLESNLMAVRTENGNPTVLNIQKDIVDGKAVDLSNITKIYTVMEFLQDNWKDDATKPYANRRIDADSWCDEYYWIALPYDCYVGDIFGIEGYGSGDDDSWVLQRYRGDLRAQLGWWAETETWWEDMTRTDTLKAGQGYVLRVTNLNGDHGKTKRFAGSSGGKLYLYFPSIGNNLKLGLVLDGSNELATSMTSTVPAHTCDKWRGKDDKPQTNEGNPRYDRRAIDSNWNIIGSPSFNSTKIISPTWGDKYPTSPKVTGELKFFYTWAANTDPKYTVKTSSSFSSFEFKATHAYLVQYAGDITWEPYDDSNPLVELKAPKRTNDENGDQTLQLVLMQDTVQADVTYISRMAEGATEGYDLNMDLSKLTSATGNNLYTIAGYYKMAGNCLPDTTSIVPVGVMIAQDGEYTFAMPEGTNGTGVVLVDEVANTRTNLALTDYTVTLAKGTIEGRFSLELSPIKTTPTDIDNIQGGETQTLKARKTIVDGVLYIVKDGQVFDARGNRVE